MHQKASTSDAGAGRGSTAQALPAYHQVGLHATGVCFLIADSAQIQPPTLTRRCRSAPVAAQDGALRQPAVRLPRLFHLRTAVLQVVQDIAFSDAPVLFRAVLYWLFEECMKPQDLHTSAKCCSAIRWLPRQPSDGAFL